MSIPLNTIYSYFETGDFPTQEQFKASWSSFWHKDEPISTTKIAGLDSLLQNKVDKNMYELHLADANAHTSILAKRDASNLNSENVQSWKTMLEVGNLPSNTATVDDFDELGNISEFGNVYTKNQSHNTFISFGDYTDNNGNILAEKIEALGLTTLIEAVETTISDFANHSDAYDFEDNDFIAIPVNNENYSLYLFKGGTKNDKSNYLSTGLSNITIGMVEGLQSELNKIKIVQEGLTNLNTNLQSKADKTTLDNHALSLDSHVNYLAKIDAANLNAQHIQSWKNTLGVKELQNNLATFDDDINIGNVYTKHQSDSKYMFLQDFLNDDHKILAEKIEALGLTTLIEASEKSISEFVKHLDVYKFENNDFIAVPDERGNFSLYLFKGGNKADTSNYLSTGLSNITMGMVEGLSGELNKIQVVQDGLTNLNTNLQYKADKATVLEQFGTFTTDLQSKADKITLQQEVNRIKVVEDGLADVNTNLEIKADKATVLEQFGTFTTDLQSKADKITLQQEVNRIKVVEDGLVNVNATLQYKADKATIQEQLGGVNANLQNKADKEALENHLWSADSHISYLTKRDASNLDSKNIDDWQRALGIVELTQPKTNYKIYRALLRVDEKSFEPRFTILENTIGDIDWKRNDVGLYTGSLEKAFPEGRVWINSKINIPFSKSSPVDCMAVRFDDNIVNLNILARNQDYIPVDMEGEFGIIEIYVYDK